MGRKPTNKNRTTTSLKINPEIWRKIKLEKEDKL